MKFHHLPLLLLSILSAKGVVLTEVSFSIQNKQLTWYELANPTNQGTISLSGLDLQPSFAANSLALDTARNRLLFTNGNPGSSQNIFSVELGGLVLSPGMAVAGTATSIGSFNFGTNRELLGGSFFNGSYYTLLDGTDTLVRVGFDASGNPNSQVHYNLPTDAEMNLGDLAFDKDGDLWISGFNENSVSRLWHFSTADLGETFSLVENLETPDRVNGIGFNQAGDTLYGYNVDRGYGTITQDGPDAGELDITFDGGPFDLPGDLSSATIMPVIPEPSSAMLILAGAGLAALRRRRVN